MAKKDKQDKTVKFDKRKRQQVTTSRNWYLDRYETVKIQRNLFLGATLLSLLSVLAFSVVLSFLTPLKTVEPYVIRVDEKTGRTQIVDPMQARQLTANHDLTRYFIWGYVKARESYNVDNYKQYYQSIALMSKRSVFREFAEEYDPKNSSSPLNRFGQKGERSVTLRSMVFLEPNLVQVRVRITEKGMKGSYDEERIIDAIITMRFEFKKLAFSRQELYINPLGFWVTSYRLEEEYVS